MPGRDSVYVTDGKPSLRAPNNAYKGDYEAERITSSVYRPHNTNVTTNTRGETVVKSGYTTSSYSTGNRPVHFKGGEGGEGGQGGQGGQGGSSYRETTTKTTSYGGNQGSYRTGGGLQGSTVRTSGTYRTSGGNQGTYRTSGNTQRVVSGGNQGGYTSTSRQVTTTSGGGQSRVYGGSSGHTSSNTKTTTFHRSEVSKNGQPGQYYEESKTTVQHGNQAPVTTGYSNSGTMGGSRQVTYGNQGTTYTTSGTTGGYTTGSMQKRVVTSNHKTYSNKYGN